MIAIRVQFPSWVDYGNAGCAGQVTAEVVAKHAMTADEQNDRWRGVVMRRNHLSSTVEEALQRKIGQSVAVSDCTAETGRGNRVHLRQRLAGYFTTIPCRSAYKDFLALWKDADPDIPILKQAKAEFAKLQ